MKKSFVFSLLLGGLAFVFGQNSITQDAAFIQKEMKANSYKMLNGSTNPNTLNYDLTYQRLDLHLDPAQYYVSGSVTSHFKPNTALSSVYFDLNPSMVVSEVKYHGSNVPFTQLATKEIKIDLPASLASSVTDSLTIHYAGIPDVAGGAFKTDVQNGSPVLFTLNEPFGAQDWFPTKQSMNDKIDKVDFKIVTPSQYSVAANGKLMSETILPSTEKLTFWRTMYPTAAYLIALSITDFVKINDTMGNPPFPFVNYLYSSSVANPTTMSNIEWTKQVMTTFETYFGPYPFRNEKYGHMEFSYWGVCMEHQTMSSMSGWGQYVIAHELAHQWFGDKITCSGWNHIWLNEGFATFGEHLANEKLLMNHSDFMNYLAGQKNYICSAPDGAVYVSDTAVSGGMGTIFNGRLVYAKGGYLLRMLKWILGENTFYSAVQDYLSRPDLAYSYANSNDLKNSLLLSTGKDFTEFFNDWLYGEGYPTYTIKWSQNSTNQNVTLLIQQTQSHPSVSFYEMPLPIKVIGTSGQIAYLRLENTVNNQYFVESVGFPIATVEFNYEHQILEKNSTVINDNALSVQNAVSETFAVYPNPAKNELFVQGIKSKTDYFIYSEEGRLVQKGIFETGKPIEVSKLKTGNYVISLDHKSVKFIKK